MCSLFKTQGLLFICTEASVKLEGGHAQRTYKFSCATNQILMSKTITLSLSRLLVLTRNKIKGMLKNRLNTNYLCNFKVLALTNSSESLLLFERNKTETMNGCAIIQTNAGTFTSLFPHHPFSHLFSW